MVSKRETKRKKAEAIVDKYLSIIKPAVESMRKELKPLGYKVRFSTTPAGYVDLEAYI